jgi:hypothetical protein
MAGIDLEKIKIANILKSRFEMFANWDSDFAISEPGRAPEFRGSAIPHCPIYWAAESQRKTPKVDERGFMLDFMAERGRLTHEMTQKWLGIVGVMFGKWKCKKCGALTPEAGSSVKGVLGPVYHCDMPCEYVEYDMIRPEYNFGGHCDGVVFVGGKYMPIEMKERDQTVIAQMLKTDEAKFDNLLQCTSYRHELPRLLTPTIKLSDWHDHVAVIYISRQDVRKRAIVIHAYDQEIFRSEVRSVQRTRRIIEIGCWNRLHGICKTQNDNRFCEYNSACFSKDPMKSLEKILPGISKPKSADDIPERFRRVNNES